MVEGEVSEDSIFRSVRKNEMAIQHSRLHNVKFIKPATVD